MAQSVKQPYQSKVRTEAAQRTRRLIREAATTLFVEQGVAATTMRQIAAVAGVGERTVYAVFPTKGALFREALNVTTVGDEDSATVAQRPGFQAYLTETDPQRAVELFVEHGIALRERVGGLVMAAFESAGADADMRELIGSAKAAMTANMHAVAEAWQRNGILRADLDADEAAGILFALAGPVVHHQLRHDQGWSLPQYSRWLTDTLLRTVMTPGLKVPV